MLINSCKADYLDSFLSTTLVFVDFLETTGSAYLIPSFDFLSFSE